METPSSRRKTGRVLVVKFDESEKRKTRLRQRSALLQNQDRSALIDISNDSPIVGLVTGNLQTPSSENSKKRTTGKQGQCTPSSGSGEALLRGQVKTLLKKVEEEGELAKITPEKRPFFNLLGNAPMTLVARTPANTPQLFNHSEGHDVLPYATPVTEKFWVQQIVLDKKQEVIEYEDLITRSLLMDFSDKSASSKASSSTDDDASSIWSVQAHACGSMKDFEDEEVGEEYVDEGDDNGLLDDLCKELSTSLFQINSDDEIGGHEEVSN